MSFRHSLGGIFGPSFIIGVTLSVPVIGTGLTMMITLLGQITGSMIVREFGYWYSLKGAISRYQTLGISIMFIGIVIIKFL